MRLTLFTEKIGVFGAIIAAMGCASCFPALGALGAAVGMGFLAQFEGLFINTLLPFFAWLALIAALIAGVKHRRWWRLLLSVAGPLMILATLYLFWTDSWSTPMFYFAIALMLVTGIADLIRPPQRRQDPVPAEENR
ncbi:organomercurial transporter MerC [Aliamphritea spongicola]|uniref:organomercurial transporter MerC n=1 Tax=Aliamphritea spongicola TaxID=707589 RepID=UPI00196B23C6|nr:organomercurial transporter MerC [Aliamphritea spongicola]MBN3561105.1 organomercurial transporter MerC [Aliamphritea spongicola]